MPRDTYKWAANSLIDGSVPLNSIPHADLQGGDLCVVIKQGDCAYHYVYDGLSEAPQDVPNVIAPQDAGANPGRWVLHRVYDTAVSLVPVTISVGPTGHYATINEALEYATRTYYPVYRGDQPRVVINLLSDFVMAEQVLVNGLDLAWITITGDSAETTIQRSALTTTFGTGYPAFGVINGGFLPIISQLFNMDTSGVGTGRHGVVAFKNSRAIVTANAGVKNAGGTGIYAAYSSIIDAPQAVATGAGRYGIYAVYGSIINADGADASDAAVYGFAVDRGSSIEATGAQGSLSVTANTLSSYGIIFRSN